MTRDRYQLWVKWKDQPADLPQAIDDWTLHKTVEKIEDLFFLKAELEKQGNKVMLTKSVTLKVEMI